MKCICLSNFTLTLRSAFFKVIEAQMTFVRTLKAFHGGILRRIVQSPTLTLPHLQRVFTELTILLDLHSHLLSQMHDHQKACHPLLTDIVGITFDSVVCWADHYNIYASVLFDALDELGRFSADIFPLVHAAAHPILADQDISTLIWLPINHLRRLSKSFHALLDVTADHHHDTKPTVEVISTINKLIEICDSLTSTTGSSPQMRQLATQLQWSGEEDQVGNISHLQFLGSLTY
jgi:RhoGEF domain